MSGEHPHREGGNRHDVAPGEEAEVDVVAGVRGYLIGLALALILTGASF